MVFLISKECCCQKNLAAGWLKNSFPPCFGNVHVNDLRLSNERVEEFFVATSNVVDNTVYIILYASSDNPS